MAFLNENEWILLNEIAYNISFIYTVEEMQQEMLNRWLPFLIPYFCPDLHHRRRGLSVSDARGVSPVSAGSECLGTGEFKLRRISLGSVYLQRWGLSGIQVRSGGADKKSRNLPELLFAQPPDPLGGTLDLFPGGAGGPIAAVS